MTVAVNEFLVTAKQVITVDLQWLEHRWLVYHGCFELILEPLGKKSHSCRFGIIQGDFLLYVENGRYVVCTH